MPGFNRQVIPTLTDLRRALTGVACSRAAAALLVLLAGNTVLAYWKPLADVDPESLPATHTWVWWATREFLDYKKPADVVLLGSSLLMHPVSRLDADFLNRDLDYVRHHRSVYMEAAISQRFGVTDPLCFNFALPGGMVSDGYMVARALFDGQRKPRIVVLGLCLRDFMDNGVTWCGGTPAFRYLKRFVNIDDLVDLAMPQIWQRLEYGLGKVFYLWDKHQDIQVVTAETARVYARRCLRHIFGSSVKDHPEWLGPPPNARSEVEEGMFIVRAHQPSSFQDNTAEYKKRYRSPNARQFAVQTEFLHRLLRLCRCRNIKVVIVNMPLTQVNMHLTPPGSYEKYVAVLRAASRCWNCPVVDLNAGGRFATADFYDTVHMNSHGGKKLLDAIVAEIASNRDLSGQLTGPRPDAALLATSPDSPQ